MALLLTSKQRNMPHSKEPLQESLARSCWGHLARELGLPLLACWMELELELGQQLCAIDQRASQARARLRLQGGWGLFTSIHRPLEMGRVGTGLYSRSANSPVYISNADGTTERREMIAPTRMILIALRGPSAGEAHIRA